MSTWYNIQRALGACVDETERILGIAEVRNTVKRTKYIQNSEKEIKAALDSCLHRIEAARYDTHDGQIIKALTGHDNLCRFLSSHNQGIVEN